MAHFFVARQVRETRSVVYGLKNRSAQVTVALSVLLLQTPAGAVDFGPDGMFSLTGFAEVTATTEANVCINCQVADPNTSKHVRAADAIIPGKPYGNATGTLWQIQPYLGAKYNLGGGYEVSALLSQRYRYSTVEGNSADARYQGYVDIPNSWYEKNIAIKHDDYGSVRIGAMTSRSWSVADYPYGSNLGLAYEWGSSNSGYGMLGNAIRIGSRQFDVAEGDLFMELTYDQGNTNFTRLKPALYEAYAQFHKGDLVMDMVYQDATNGAAGAFGHAPFSGISPYAVDDSYTSTSGVQFASNHQTLALLMARYQYNSKVEISGGIRRNYWSGAPLVFNPATQWTTAFNVDYSNPLAASNPGVSAGSTDMLLGARYRSGPWTFFTGMVYMGAADTSNPSDRGQTNTALINTLGARYDVGKGLILEGTVGAVHYGKKGLSPMSMPDNNSFGHADSRVSQDGNWLTVGFVYVF